VKQSLTITLVLELMLASAQHSIAHVPS
jgi:hypothetical protein